MWFKLQEISDRRSIKGLLMRLCTDILKCAQLLNNGDIYRNKLDNSKQNLYKLDKCVDTK